MKSIGWQEILGECQCTLWHHKRLPFLSSGTDKDVKDLHCNKISARYSVSLSKLFHYYVSRGRGVESSQDEPFRLKTDPKCVRVIHLRNNVTAVWHRFISALVANERMLFIQIGCRLIFPELSDCVAKIAAMQRVPLTLCVYVSGEAFGLLSTSLELVLPIP